MQRRVELCAVGWFALVLAADLTLRSVALIGLVNIATLLVSAVSPVRRVVTFGLAALLVAGLSPLWDTGQTTSTEVVRVLNCVLLSGVAIMLTVLGTRRERQVGLIVDAAEAAQRAVLPTLPKNVGRVELAARYHSAADEAMVGGDVFDMFYDENGKVTALVGDVAGHGLGSVQQGARLIRAFRQYAPTSQTLEQLAAQMNAYIVPFLADDEFVTAVLADVSSPEHFTVASCGHPAPLLLTASGLTEVGISYSPPLGLGAPDQTRTHPWRLGDRLLLHTDGLTEARDRHNRFLPTALLQPAMRTGTADEAVDAVIETLEGYVDAGRMQDDVCLMVIENRGPAPEARDEPT
jgi:phosphoserine phosphatase RsbU/P